MAEDLNAQQKPTQNDEELQLKKRARRRLVGAIALVLAMLVILPMILDDKATKPQAPITITIPNEDNTTLTPENVPLPPVDAQPERLAPAPVIPVPPPVPVVEPRIINDPPVPEIDPPKPDPVLEPDPEAGPEPKPNPIPIPPKPEPVKPEPVATQKVEKAEKKIAKVEKVEKVEKPAAVKPASNKAGHFAVQIGVFSNADSVKDLQVKLLADGVKTHTDTIKTDKGDKIRLRTGSFDSRAAATEALNSIKTAGVTGMIVAE